MPPSSFFAGSNHVPRYRPVSPSNVATTSRYSSGTKARIASSRSTSIASVGVWTRPTESFSSVASVKAREKFIPTSQSARLRPRAASASRSYSLAGFSRARPSRIASGVSDEIQSLFTGFVQPAAS